MIPHGPQAFRKPSSLAKHLRDELRLAGRVALSVVGEPLGEPPFARFAAQRLLGVGPEQVAKPYIVTPCRTVPFDDVDVMRARAPFQIALHKEQLAGNVLPAEGESVTFELGG